ncbi:MAG: hypothetical protein ACP6IQ_02620 [Candidatus Njordarchaeia archaeon]
MNPNFPKKTKEEVEKELDKVLTQEKERRKKFLEQIGYDSIMLVGIAGLAGSGKDTLAKMLKEGLETAYGYKVEIIPFAKRLKEMCIQYFGLTEHQVYTQEGKQEYLEDYDMTVREFLQKLGTDALRNQVHEDIHIKMFDKHLEDVNANIVIIPDVRFRNEYEYVKQYGMVIYIKYGPGKKKKRRGRPRNRVHESENLWWIQGEDIDWVVDNSGSLSDLEMQHYNIIRSIDSYFMTGIMNRVLLV